MTPNYFHDTIALIRSNPGDDVLKMIIIQACNNRSMFNMLEEVERKSVVNRPHSSEYKKYLKSKGESL